MQTQSLFRRLAVFAGGFTIRATEAVVLSTCAAEPGSRNLNPQTSILDSLESLVDHSFLRASEVDGRVRFTMLETIREYALERLEESGEKSVTQQRHARLYLALVEEAEPELEGAGQETWLDELEREYDNLRAALAWAAENAAGVGLRLAAALGWFWNNRGRFSEGRDWLAAALSRGAACGPELDRWRAKALSWAGWLATFQEDETAALSLGRESVALWRALGEASGLAQALARHAWMVWKRDRAGARSLLKESIDLCRQIDDKPGLAYALWVDAYRALQAGDHERGRARAAESLNLARECGAAAAVARAAGVLSSVAFARGDYPTARSSLEESLALSREANDRFDTGDILSRLGNVWYVQGEYGRARVYYQEALQICRAAGARYATAGILAKLAYAASRQGLEAEARACLAETWALCRGTAFERGGIAGCLLGWAGLAEAQGQPERAARLLGTIEAIVENVEWQLTIMFPLEYERVVSAVRGQLDEATFAAAWVEGRAMAAAAADEGWERERCEHSI
jgi:tetratricopeptide (TPR) repeat protein